MASEPEPGGDEFAERIGLLADALRPDGEPVTEPWRAALRAAPRHLFAPDVAWVAPYGGAPVSPIDRGADPSGWLDAVYRPDQALVTQFDDGNIGLREGGPGGACGADGADSTSSLSAADVVMEFLTLLEPYDGDEVLDIGTGTGWTAALLSARLGEDRVTSIEVDPQVAEEARGNLGKAGIAPELVVGDGTKGHPDRAPYDRIHVTAGVRDIPYAWVEQLRDGGMLVLPWMPGVEGHKVRLTRMPDGTAIGTFAGGAYYMMLRSQRSGPAADPGERRTSKTAVDPRRVVRASYGLDVALIGSMPGVRLTADWRDDHSCTLWLDDGESYAAVQYHPDSAHYAVMQSGPRNLWDEAENVLFQWVAWASLAVAGSA